MWISFSPLKLFSSCSLLPVHIFRDERQVGHKQGGLHTPRWEDACCCAGEEEDQEEDPLPGHRWSGRLHDLHLHLRSEDKPLLCFCWKGFTVFVYYVWVLLLRPKFTFQHVSFNVPLMFPLMSMFSFPLTIEWHAKSVYCWALAQSLLNRLNLRWKWIIVSPEFEVLIISFFYLFEH